MHLLTKASRRILSLEVGMAIFAGILQAAESRGHSPKVDFSYAFATPHRVTVGRPDMSDRTLLDLQPSSLRMTWTYDDLTHYPLASFKVPPASWNVQLTPQVDGHRFAKSRWARLEGYLPALENTYEDPAGIVRMEVLGGQTAALARIEIVNTDDKPHQFVVRCDSGALGENPGWVEPERWVADNIVAGWNERADRVLILACGADKYSLAADGRAPGPKNLVAVRNLAPKAKKAGWLGRSYRAYGADLDNLRQHDWAQEFVAGAEEWRSLIRRASELKIPDPGLVNAFRACLGDVFIMREPVADGYLAGLPGTECYRAANAIEAGIGAIGLDQFGLHKEAADGYRMCIEMQGVDGNWNDPQGWGHLVWCCAGFKAWAGMEHYRLTADRNFLAKLYPHLLANSRWQERERARTRKTGDDGQRRLNYGLLPRGFGDCGLNNDGDLYGVFLPHNIWAVYADRLAVEAAETLNQTADAAELRRIYETAKVDLLATLDHGAIREKDYRWIPGVAGKTSGSRWGALNVFFPCRLLPADHELVTGTLRKVESQMSPGGIPINTGWLADGMWVAVALDNVAEVHLARGDGDQAAKYLYATLNHATPLVTWCEERGPEPGAVKCTGDRQHLWTPVAVIRAVRDCLVMEDGDSLHLGRGTERQWLATGQAVGISQAATHFGPVSYEMKYDAAGGRVSGEIMLRGGGSKACKSLLLHVRLPDGMRITGVNPESGATVLAGGETLEWKAAQGKVHFNGVVGK